MELHEYLLQKETELAELIRSSSFRNQYGQIFAKKMGATFNATYNEHSIWGYALFLSSASTKILKYKSSDVAEYGLKIAAELFETFSIMADFYDRDYANLLAAMCYDLAGYQANAQCLLKYNYQLEVQDKLDTSTNELIQLITTFMQGKLQEAKRLTERDASNSETGEMEQYWRIGINEFSDFQLIGETNEYGNKFFEAKQYAIALNDAILTTILSLLDLKCQISQSRTTWTVLRDEIQKKPEIWRPYLRLLSMNPYSKEQVVPIDQRTSRVEMWKSQIRAIEQGVLGQNRGFIIQMPTSAGKTWIAEMAILQQIGQDRKCLYIAPFRALVNEVENTLSQHLSKLGYLVSSLSGSYELDEFDQFWIRESDVLVATPEKVDFLFRVSPSVFENIGLVVVDEGHVLGNLDERSAQFEMLLTRLKREFATKDVRMLFISAVMPDADSTDFARWLIGKEESKIISPRLYDQTMWQPTRRLLGKFNWVGDNGQVEFGNYVRSTERALNRFFIPNLINPLRVEIPGKRRSRTIVFPNSKSQTTALLAHRYLQEGPVLVFCGMVARKRGGGVYSVLRAFLELIDILDQYYPSRTFPNVDSSEAVESSIRWYGEDHIITRCLRRGVAPHFGDLAEEVRKAVEREYAERKLSVIVATSTLGQGVNLPIKTILVFSLDINPNPQNHIPVKVRDFWNIVGRTGRAGKETEGQIVFIQNSSRDAENYIFYTNPNNTERVQSIFTVAMELFHARSITRVELEDIIGGLTEPSLMSFLMEEIVETPDEDLINSFIGDTLFKIQSTESYVKEVNKIILNRAQRFWDIETRERKKAYAKTGFSLASCQSMEQLIRELEGFDSIVLWENKEDFINACLKAFTTCSEMTPKEALKDVPIFGNEGISQFILAWITGAELDELRGIWAEAVGEEHSDLMNVFIEDCLYYRFPWGVTAMIMIGAFVLGVEADNLGSDIRSLPSSVKYGLSEQKALWLRGIGITSRESCLYISGKYTGSSDIQEFGNWFLNLAIEDFGEMGISSPFVLRNLMNVSSRLSLQTNRRQSTSTYRFIVKGIPFDANRIASARTLKNGDQLMLKRDPSNEYDPYAIQVWVENNQLGFVPRELAKKLSFEIDVMFKRIDCIVERRNRFEVHAIARL